MVIKKPRCKYHIPFKKCTASFFILSMFSVRLMNEFTNMPVPPKPRQGESYREVREVSLNTGDYACAVLSLQPGRGEG
jgi:hypothetical protein